VLVQIRHHVLTIPSAAVQRGPNGVFAYVVKPDSTVEMRPLKLGEEAGSITIVEQGLQDGERVTTSNQYRLQPNVRVQILAADAGASGNAARSPAP
jgi:multidrug efflux system membrane fusion protein